MHVARGNGGDHFRAAVEAAPVELLADDFLVGTVGLGHLGRVDAGLVAEGDIGLGGASDADQGKRGQQAARGTDVFHVELLEMRTKAAGRAVTGRSGERREIGDQLLATSGCHTGTARASTGLGSRPSA